MDASFSGNWVSWSIGPIRPLPGHFVGSKIVLLRRFVYFGKDSGPRNARNGSSLFLEINLRVLVLHGSPSDLLEKQSLAQPLGSKPLGEQPALTGP